MSGTEEANGDVAVLSSSYEYLLQNLVREHCSKDDITVRVKDVQEVVSAGDNYLGSLRRVFLEVLTADLEVKVITVIVKMLPKGEYIQKYVKSANIFLNEIIMYKNVLPEMNRVASNMPGFSTFSARFFDTGDDSFLAMEDLKQTGYKMANKHAGLDLCHSKMAVKALARFHGVSVAMVKSDESILNVLPASSYRKELLQEIDSLLRYRFEELAEVVETWPGFERFGGKLRDTGVTAAEKAVHANDPSNTELAVLNHGDFWLNNVLFRYSDSGEVEDVKFVDFQMIRYASPAIDLHYFLTTTPSEEIKQEGAETLLEVYHSELCSVLESLGCDDKCVTLEWLKNEMKDKNFHSVHTACCYLNLILADAEEVPDFSQIRAEHGKNGHKSVFFESCNGTKYREELQKLLPKFEKEGVL